jgi:hypothetical protein
MCIKLTVILQIALIISSPWPGATTLLYLIQQESDIGHAIVQDHQAKNTTGIPTIFKPFGRH